MNRRKKSPRRVGDEVVNAGATPQGNQVPPQVQADVNDQVPIHSPAMTDGEVRESLFQMAHAITTQAQAIRYKLKERLFLDRSNMLVLWLAICEISRG